MPKTFVMSCLAIRHLVVDVAQVAVTLHRRVSPNFWWTTVCLCDRCPFFHSSDTSFGHSVRICAMRGACVVIPLQFLTRFDQRKSCQKRFFRASEKAGEISADKTWYPMCLWLSSGKPESKSQTHPARSKLSCVHILTCYTRSEFL